MAGINSLENGKSLLASNPLEASRQFNTASTKLEESFAALRNLPWWVKIATPLPPFRWEIKMLKASHSLSVAGEEVSELAKTLPHTDDKNQKVQDLIPTITNNYLDWYSKNGNALDRLTEKVTDAKIQMSGVPAWSVIGHKKEIEQLQASLNNSESTLINIKKISDISLVGLGSENRTKSIRWLLIFQNESELRPSGGFMGSYAEITASGGRLRSFKFGQDIYKLDTASTTLRDTNNKIQFPIQLSWIIGSWKFRDSNINKGFINELGPQIAEHYKIATEQNVNGLIFLDTSILEDILKVTGPVKVQGANSELEITAENAHSQLTQEIEKDYWTNPDNVTANQPKQIINDLIPILMQKVMNNNHALEKLPSILGNAVSRKSLQFWSQDEKVNTYVKENAPTDLPATDNPWIKIVNTNLGGKKSSSNVHQKVNIDQEIKGDYLVSNINIERLHYGNGEWPDGDNHNYIEVYIPNNADVSSLPRGNILTSPLGEKLQKDYGLLERKWQTEVEKTDSYKKISFWASTKVGQKTNYRFTYKVPIKGVNNQLLYIKQAGSRNETVVFNDEPEVKIETNTTF